ncbi:Multiple coagulation factor deficiency protein 2-like protein [Camponotus floridanus]|uniref:Multiple coagulation factor deficiency protein 2-like protein n=1 Tax=Camponotus floridanus TaxID=104421 RepID=E2A6P7_CAMFO|nr:multiple coagulation factor deficiency protein 2 homolog [Camponotus floridanus]EFN70887.1 Multiple coagulation factor deficiency protein 2-like protein [Camponotus floridanus]
MYWTLCILIIGSFGCKYIHAQAQRVAPGVPPQHYQQPGQVPQQHMHQVPQQQQYQQVPMQQQAPVQHIPIQQQAPVQQVPIQQQAQQGHRHVHDQSHGQPQLLNTANIIHEKEHIAEHADVPIDTNKMTEQELQFHYFKMHDADNNNKLDGCELIKSLIHWHEQGNVEGKQNKLFKDEELVQLIDPILSMDDTNNDGYIDYPEFIQAQQNAAAAATNP